MKIKIYKIRPDKKTKLADWAKELSTTRKDQALSTLKEELVEREYLGLFEIDGQPYAVGFMYGECLPALDSELNRKHKEVLKDCIEHSTSIETLYDLEA